MNISVRQERTIIVKNGTVRSIYSIPYKVETDCHKHQQHNTTYCKVSKNDGIEKYVVCVEYYIK